MSYEGYEQHICEDGHRFDTESSPASMYSDHDELCHCGKKSIFSNFVDCTNDEEWGQIINWDSLLLSPFKTETCSHCSHTKVVEEARYRLPTDQELENLRCYWDRKQSKHRPLKDYR